MRVAVVGSDSPLAMATREELQRRGHTAVVTHADCVIFFPGSLESLDALVADGGFQRLVLRSHACVYGSATKNPGFMTEDRISLLPRNAPEQRWAAAERIALKFPNVAIVRLTNVLHSGEGDLLVRQLASRIAAPVAGRDPQVQAISLADAAKALVSAAESTATGIFNAAAPGSIPLRAALRAAGTIRVPLPAPLLRLFRSEGTDQLVYNSTVSSERAERELGFRAAGGTVDALRQFPSEKPGARPDRLRDAYDDWGLDPAYIQAWRPWFTFLRRVYWRIESEGLEHITSEGRGMFVSNHRGFMPLDAVMHLYLVLAARNRIIRFLIIHTLLKLPHLSNFLTKLGGVIASRENAARLFAGENLVGIFPEGIRGAFTPYKSTYRLRDFSKSAFAQLAIENQAPIIPVAVVGHAEIFPILGRIEWSYLTREYGWPYLPIAPMFPLAPVPLPSKWHVRVLEPVPLDGLSPADACNPRVVREFSRYIQHIIQTNVDEMRARRRHVFWGRILDGNAPARIPFAVGGKLSARVE